MNSNKNKTRVFGILLAASAVFAFGNASAQTYSFNWNPRSGDAWIDSTLSDMNRYGAQNRTSYINEMVSHYGVSRSLVTTLLGNRWAPGDIYYACSLAQVLGRPCSYVTDYWSQNHGKGWGAVAKDLGIKPGSSQFHALKKGFVPTYDRWGRSINLSDDLRRDFPNHGKKAVKVKSGGGKAKSAAPARGNGKSGNPGGKKPSSGKGHAGHGNGNGKK